MNKLYYILKIILFNIIDKKNLNISVAIEFIFFIIKIESFSDINKYIKRRPKF